MEYILYAAVAALLDSIDGSLRQSQILDGMGIVFRLELKVTAARRQIGEDQAFAVGGNFDFHFARRGGVDLIEHAAEIFFGHLLRYLGRWVGREG